MPASVSIAGPDDIGRAARALMDLVRTLGPLRPCITHDIASRQPMVDEDGAVLAARVFGWDDGITAWWRDTSLALTSPLAKACRYESQPFWASAEGFRTVAPNPCLARIRLHRFEARARANCAIVVPVYLPLGRIGMAAYAGPDEPTIERLFHAHADRLAIASRRFVASYVAHTADGDRAAEAPLSDREVECLRWAAHGKTDREIGDILERSHSTVRFHWNNVAAKLGTQGRTQTLFRAMQLGYVT